MVSRYRPLGILGGDIQFPADSLWIALLVLPWPGFDLGAMKPVAPVLPRYPDVPVTEFAKDQSQYITLPALVGFGRSVKVTTRWELSFWELWRVFWSGEIWIQVLTFGELLQPIKILTKEPPLKDCL